MDKGSVHYERTTWISKPLCTETNIFNSIFPLTLWRTLIFLTPTATMFPNLERILSLFLMCLIFFLMWNKSIGFYKYKYLKYNNQILLHYIVPLVSYLSIIAMYIDFSNYFLEYQDLIFKFFYLVIWEAETKREWEDTLILFHFQMLTTDGGPKQGTKNSTQISHPSRRIQLFHSSPLPPRVCICRKLESGVRSRNWTQVLCCGKGCTNRPVAELLDQTAPAYQEAIFNLTCGAFVLNYQWYPLTSLYQLLIS